MREENGRLAGKFFLFGMESSLERIMGVFGAIFGLDFSGAGNTLELHNGDVEIHVFVACEDMGQEATEFLKDQATRTKGHFYRVETEACDVKTNLLYQLERTKSFVSVEYSFEAEGPEPEGAEAGGAETGTMAPESAEAKRAEAKRMAVESAFLGALPDLRAVMLIPGEQDAPDGIYIINEEREKLLILSEAGDSDLDRFVPYPYPMDRLEPGNEISQEQLDRRQRNRKIFEEKGIYVPAFYPVIESEEEAACRTPEEIAKRAVALMTVSVFSEALLQENMTQEEALDFVMGHIEGFDAEEYFSPREWAYLHNPNSSEQERISFSWQYENLYVMEWALGLLGEADGELDFPDHCCDVPLTVRVLRDCKSIEEILAIANPRSSQELLDACDMIFCLDWACVDTRMRSLPAPAGMDGGVVMERHKSLNWLVGAGESAPWDEVGTDT